MRSIVILLVTGIFLLTAVTSRFAALLLYWWIAVFRPFDWIYIDVASARIPLVAGLLLVVPCLLTGRWPRLGHPISYLMLFWLALGAIAAQLNGCVTLGPSFLVALAKLMLVLFLANRLVDSPSRVFWLLTLIASSIAFYSAKGGFFALIKGGVVQHGYDGLGGTLTGGNAFALFTAMMIFWMIATAQNALNPTAEEPEDNGTAPERWQRLLRVGMWIAVPFSIYQVIALFSRGSALGLVCGFGAYFLLQKRRTVWLLGMLPLVLFLAIVPLPEGYDERIASAFAKPDELEASAKSRPHFWKVATAITKDHPIGVGPGCFVAYYDDYDHGRGMFGTRRSVHSSHFQALAETGYVGVATWASLFVLSLLALARVRRAVLLGGLPPALSHFLFTYSNAVSAGIVTFLVGGSFYEYAHNEFIWLSFMMAVILERLAKEAPSRSSGDTIRIEAADSEVPWYRNPVEARHSS